MELVYEFIDYLVYDTHEEANPFKVMLLSNGRAILKYKCLTKEEAINFVDEAYEPVPAKKSKCVYQTLGMSIGQGSIRPPRPEK